MSYFSEVDSPVSVTRQRTRGLRGTQNFRSRRSPRAGASRRPTVIASRHILNRTEEAAAMQASLLDEAQLVAPRASAGDNRPEISAQTFEIADSAPGILSALALASSSSLLRYAPILSMRGERSSRPTPVAIARKIRRNNLKRLNLGPRSSTSSRIFRRTLQTSRMPAGAGFETRRLASLLGVGRRGASAGECRPKFPPHPLGKIESAPGRAWPWQAASLGKANQSNLIIL